MADVKEVTISRSVRMNTGQYEGTEFFISMRAELDGLDPVEDETRELERRVEAAMLAQLMRGYKARGKAVTAEQVAKQHGIGGGL